MLQLWVIYLAFTLLFKPWHEIGWSPNISLTEERKTLILSLPRDERKGKMVFYFKARAEAGNYIIFHGVLVNGWMELIKDKKAILACVGLTISGICFSIFFHHLPFINVLTLSVIQAAVHKEPIFSIPGTPAIVQHEILNNRRHVLTKVQEAPKLSGSYKGLLLQLFIQCYV
ncbi:hypothetical protein ES288_D04G088700v1 [Gossypium darwinii]|uniref:Uncharacterized protein n=1 Tax=Gossypium darwinii TaxID=34276 RepID=A0A5D2CX10_GOSDA|nr:hypothetical protein ES288_D04G088700v1 [Gossypium darwinii]